MVVSSIKYLSVTSKEFSEIVSTFIIVTQFPLALDKRRRISNPTLNGIANSMYFFYKILC